MDNPFASRRNRAGLPRGRSGYEPTVDVGSLGDHYLVEVDVPGFAEADLRYFLEDGLLVIEGGRVRSALAEPANWLFSERRFGGFRRELRLPRGDARRVHAALADGVWSLTVCKLIEMPLD